MEKVKDPRCNTGTWGTRRGHVKLFRSQRHRIYELWHDQRARTERMKNSTCSLHGRGYDLEMNATTEQLAERASGACPRSPEIDKMLRGSVLHGASSINLGWNGFVIERHSVSEGEKPEKCSDHHFILLWDVHSCRGERANPHGRFVPYSRRPGAISLFGAGVIPALRSFTKMEVIAGAFSPSLINQAEEGVERRSCEAAPEKINFHDASFRMLMSLLIAESDAGGPNGRLYADSLVHALTVRFVVNLGRAAEPHDRAKSGLPRHLLRRVLERMNAEFAEDLSLTALAAESGYSRAHFLRMFRVATGQTPHQYLLSLRLENAVRMMKDRSLPLIDIAVASGFSSHTHFTRVFRSKFGVLPSQYRRSL